MGGIPPSRGTCSAEVEDTLTVIGCQADVLRVGETLSGSITVATSSALTGELSNTAFVGSGALDRALLVAGSQNEATAVGPIVTRIDAAVDVTASAPTVAPGGTISFTVTVTNTGPSTAFDAVLVNQLPAGFTGATASSALEAGCTIAGLTATCPLGDLAPGAGATFRFTGLVPTDTAGGTVLTDSAH